MSVERPCTALTGTMREFVVGGKANYMRELVADAMDSDLLLSPDTQKWGQARLVHFRGSTGGSDARSQLGFVGRTGVWEAGGPRF